MALVNSWGEFRRAVLARVVSCAVLCALILLIGDLQRALATLPFGTVPEWAVVAIVVTASVLPS